MCQNLASERQNTKKVILQNALSALITPGYWKLTSAKSLKSVVVLNLKGADFWLDEVADKFSSERGMKVQGIFDIPLWGPGYDIGENCSLSGKSRVTCSKAS